MNSWVLSSSPFLVSLLFIVLFFIKIPLSLCDEDMHESCSNMFNCGKLNNIGFPFWGDNRPNSCGYPGLKLNCQGSVATIKIMNVTYQVLGVKAEAQILKITREDFSAGVCSPEFVNSTLDPTLLDFGIGLQNLTIVYGCDFSLIPYPGLGQFNCQKNGFAHIKWGAYGPGECKVSVVVPVPVQFRPSTETEIDQSKLEEGIREGFDVKWKVDTAACLNCTVYKGVCGYDLKRNQSTCYHSSPEKERERKKDSQTQLERERERERRTHRQRPNPRRSDKIAPSSLRRRSLSFSISLSLLNRNPPNTTTAKFEFRQRVPTLKIQPDKDVYHLGDPLIVTIQISNPDTASSLLLDRIGFEIRAVEKLDSQWFATHKPLPGSSPICFLANHSLADLLDLFDL
uniref:non-specific serine/threonine protein kinase n=1 Tax=Quercus lobata TaxID=97700 RepID=A0A7N2KKN6_QUELO